MSTFASDPILRIGWVPALPMERLLDFVGALRRREPSVSIRVAHLFSLEQVKRLRAGELDLGILFDPEDHTDLETEPLFAGESLVAYLPSDHRLTARQVIRADDVREETLVTGPRSTNRAVYERTLDRFAQAGYRFQGVKEAGGATGRDLLFAVATGMGIALAPTSLKEVSGVSHLLSRRPLDPALQMPVTAVAWRANAPRGLRTILESVRQVARELSDSRDVVETYRRSDPTTHRAAHPQRSTDEASPSQAAVTQGPHPTRRLTERQLEVLHLLVDGKSTEEMATELGVSSTTVRNHVANLIAALGVHTRLQAVVAASRAGLVDL